MTYQSSPNYPLIFPDQAPRLNRFGVQPLKANVVHHAQLEPAAHKSHPSWREDAHKMALAKVQNTKSWQNRMLKEMPSVKGKQAYTTKRHVMCCGSCSGKCGGICGGAQLTDTDMSGGRVLNGLVWNPDPRYPVPDSAIIQAINSVKAAKFGTPEWVRANQSLSQILRTTNYSFLGGSSGGRSDAIQDDIDVLLKNRIGQYGEIDSASFFAVSPDRLYTPIPVTDPFGMDALFADMITSLDAGEIKPALSRIGTITNSLMTNADKLSINSFDTYLGVVRRAIQIANAMNNETFFRHEGTNVEKSKAIISAIIKELEGLGEFLVLFVTYANRPIAERTSLLANIRKNLLAESLKNSRWTISE